MTVRQPRYHRFAALPLLQLLLMHAPVSLLAQGGSIQGVVLGEDSRPVKGAVLVSTIAPRARGKPTGEDGRFNLTGLLAGTHSLCVQVPGGDLLDPCRWAAAQQVNLAAGENRAGLQIRLQRGVRISVKIDDPAGYRLRQTGGNRSVLLIGVWGRDGLFNRAVAVRKGGAATEYQVLVPFQTQLRLSVHSSSLLFEDTQGVAVPRPGVNLPFQVPSGQNAAFRYRILGIVPR
jgi:hypothetical protein